MPPIELSTFVVVAFAIVAFVAVRFVVKRSVNIAIKDVMILLTDRFDQIVLVPVVEAFPTVTFPLSFTANVDEPILLRTCSEVEVDDVPTPVNEYLPVLVDSRFTRKFTSSVHEAPFQYCVLPVAVPASAPASDVHLVLVPLLESICPSVPVAPCESLIPKLKNTSPMKVEVASVFVPFANRLPRIVVVARVVVPIVVRLLVVAFVATRFVVNRLLNTAVIAFSMLLIERFDQMVDVPVVDAFPDTKFPRSFTLNVDEPTLFLVCSTVEVEDVPTPIKPNLAAVVVERSELNAVFSTQADPFQYSAEPVARPLATEPVIDTHLVLVPVVERYCPRVPVAPVASLTP